MSRLLLPISIALALLYAFPTEAQVAPPWRGGTGTATSPAYGQVLIGDGTGVYKIVATSSLGIQSGLSSLNGLTGGAQTFATSSDANILIRIVSIGTAHTFYPEWTGVLSVARGGTGSSSPSQFLFGTGADIVSTSTIAQNFIDSAIARVAQLAGYLSLSSWYATTTDALQEGATNRYFTDNRADARARAVINASTSIPQEPGQAFGDLLRWSGSRWLGVATSTLGIFWNDVRNIPAGFADGVDDAFSTTSADYWDGTKTRWATSSSDYWLTTKSTSNLTEGSNLYYTLARFASALAGTTTNALSEGSTNKYYTDARVGTYVSGSSTIPHTGGSAWGDLLRWTGSAWSAIATSTLGIAWGDLRGVPAGFADGTDDTGNPSDRWATSSDLTSIYPNTATKVGIGTSSPYAKLSVAGETVAQKFTATDTTATSSLPRIFSSVLAWFQDLYAAGNAVINGNLTVNGTSTLGTTTTAMLNGTIVVDGVHYARSSDGIQSALDVCKRNGGGTVQLLDGTTTVNHSIYIPSYCNLVGQSTEHTVLLIDPNSITTFGTFILIGSDDHGSTYVATGTKVSTLKLDANYDNLPSHPGHNGGLVGPANGWTIENVHLASSNSFRIYSDTKSDVIIRDNIFSGSGGNADCIGGGGMTNMTVENNIFYAGIACNAYDQVGGNHILVSNNTVYDNGSMYQEGGDDIIFRGNRVVGGGGISASSNNGYFPRNLINTHSVKFINNYLSDGGGLGYTVIGTTSDAIYTTGGDVLFDGNHIASSTNGGIWVQMGKGSDNSIATWGYGVRIVNNFVINPNTASSTTVNGGLSVVKPSCYNISQGIGVIVANNVCIDNRTNSQTWYGVQIGQTASPSQFSEPNYVTVDHNYVTGTISGEVNRVSSTYTNNYNQQDQSSLLIQQGNALFPTGFVGIGNTAAPDFPLTITATTSSQLLIKFRDNTDTPKWHIKLNNGTLGFTETNVMDNRLTLKPGGGLGIDTTASNLYSLSTAQPLNIGSTTASSTFANGIQLLGGCYRQADGTCLTNSTITFASDWVQQLNYGSLALTPSTTIPVWIKGNLYASSSILATDFTATNLTGTSTFGIIQVAAGVSAFPSISFASDPDTGLYSNGNNLIDISTGGSRRVEFSNGSFYSQVSSNGFLMNLASGLSATTPIFIPNRGDQTTGIAAGSAGNVNIIIGGSESSRWTSTGFGIGTTSPLARLTIQATSSSSTIPLLSIYSPNQTSGLATSSVFTVLPSGLVGVGTSSPYAALSVVGSTGVVAEKYNATGTATSSFAWDINLASGHCIQYNGSCISLSGGGFVADWVQQTNYGALALTASTSIPVWIKGALYASSTSALSTTTAPNINNIPYGAYLGGANGGAKANTAYNLLSGGGLINFTNQGLQTLSTAINFSTAGKRVLLQGGTGSSTVFHSTLAGTSTTINWGSGDVGGQDHDFGAGIDGLTFRGGDDVFDTSVGVVLGGSNGAEGTRISHSRITNFAKGLVIQNNTWNTSIDNSMFNGSGRNFVWEADTNAGENISIVSSVFADSWSGSSTNNYYKCFDVSKGGVGISMVNTALDDCQLYVGNSSIISLTNPWIENPAGDGTGNKYTFIHLQPSEYTTLSVSGGTIAQGATADMPDQLIYNGGNTLLSGLTVLDTGGGVAPYLVANDNLNGGGSLVLSGVSNIGGSAFAHVTSKDPSDYDVTADGYRYIQYYAQNQDSYPFIMHVTPDSYTKFWSGNHQVLTFNPSGNVGIGTSTPAAKLNVNGSAWIGTDTGGLPASAGKGIRIFVDDTYPVASLFGYNYATGASINMVLQSPGGNVGVGTSTPATTLDVNGYGRAYQNATSTACGASMKGAFFYNNANSHFWGCNGSAWLRLD